MESFCTFAFETKYKAYGIEILTNYTETTFLSTIQMNLRRCKAFDFSVSFIKKAGLVLLSKDIKAAIERGAKGRIFQCVRKIKC